MILSTEGVHAPKRTINAVLEGEKTEMACSIENNS